MILSLMFSTIIMRVENHVHIRHIMLYHFEKGHKAAEAFRDLNELFGEGTIGERQVRRWFERFKSGDTSLEEEEVGHRILMIKLYWMPWKKMKVSLPDYWLRCLMSTNQPSYGV